MGLSQKKIKQIKFVSFVEDVIKEYDEGFIGGRHWIESSPDMWNEERIKKFDMMNELETKLKHYFIAIAQGEKI
jgi:hypothetical protein